MGFSNEHLDNDDGDGDGDDDDDDDDADDDDADGDGDDDDDDEDEDEGDAVDVADDMTDLSPLSTCFPRNLLLSFRNPWVVALGLLRPRCACSGLGRVLRTGLFRLLFD